MNEATQLDVALIAQAVGTLGMVGAIWLVQLAHYPLQIHVDRSQFVDYQQAHMHRITYVVGPLMLADDYNNPKTKTADLTVMIKDNNLIEQYAKDFNAPVPVFQASMFSSYAALAQGFGQEDPGVVTRVYEQMADIPRKKRAPARRKTGGKKK